MGKITKGKDRKWNWFLCVFALILVIVQVSYAKNMFQYRYVRVAANSQNDADVAAKKVIISRAAAAGYNGLCYDDAKIPLIGTKKLGLKTVENLRSFATYARSKGMVFLPMCLSQGTPVHASINNGEAFPVKGTRFLVSGKSARVSGDHAVELKNGEFEGSTGWNIGAKEVSIGTGRTGKGLMVENPKGWSLAIQSISLKKHRAYEFKVWVKTENYTRTHEIGVYVYHRPTNVYLLHRIYGGFSTYENQWGGRVSSTQNWRQYTIDFNSLDRENVEIRVCFAKKPGTGKAWIDGLEMREVGLRETIRRSTTPVKVKSEAGVAYKEGKDFVVGRDLLNIPAGSAIKGGDYLRVDWFQRADMIGVGPSASIYHQASWDAIQAQADTLLGVFKPDGWWVKYSEWRSAFWDPAAQAAYGNSLPKFMGGVQSTTNDLLRSVSQNCNVQLLLWNDSFDPYHNSLNKNYYMLNGVPYSNWNHLDPKTIIVNWNVHHRVNSLLFFAGLDKTHKSNRPLKQILNVYNGSSKWLGLLDEAETKGLPDGAVIGINYCTWSEHNYEGIEPFAKAAQAAGRWGKGPADMGVVSKDCNLTKPTQSKTATQQAERAIAGLRISGGNRLDYVIAGKGRVKMHLMDAKGRIVERLADGHLLAGSHSLEINTSKLAHGVYFVSMNMAGEGLRLVRKMVVM